MTTSMFIQIKMGFYFISGICLWVLISSIVINFFLSSDKVVQKEKKSVVETGSMFAFFIVMTYLIYRRIGLINTFFITELILGFIGTFFIIVGTVINVFGRLTLKQNWGNQIRIYENHTLVTKGIYKFVRHPLYSSTILMIAGFSFIFMNLLVFILNLVIFIPFMIYRAKQEEVLLTKHFGDEYPRYKEKTGMLFPKIKFREKKHG